MLLEILFIMLFIAIVALLAIAFGEWLEDIKYCIGTRDYVGVVVDIIVYVLLIALSGIAIGVPLAIIIGGGE